MKAKFDMVFDVPTWATMYLYYGDSEGLSIEDKNQVDTFVLILKKQGIKRFVEPADCSECAFNKHPAFGKSCGTQDWIVEVEI